MKNNYALQVVVIENKEMKNHRSNNFSPLFAHKIGNHDLFEYFKVKAEIVAFKVRTSSLVEVSPSTYRNIKTQ